MAAFLMLPWLFRTSVGRKPRIPPVGGQSKAAVPEKGRMAPSTTKNYLVSFVEVHNFWVIYYNHACYAHY